MLTEDQIAHLADLFTCREKGAFDAGRDWTAALPREAAQREWDGDVSELDELAEASTERAYAILEEGEREDFGRVEEAALNLISGAGIRLESGAEELASLCRELMRRCILLACYEAEKYQGKSTGIYHRSLEEIAQRTSPPAH